MELYVTAAGCITVIAIFATYVSRGGGSLFPLALFIALEVAAVWPSLISSRDAIGMAPAALAMMGAGFLAIGYVLGVGSSARTEGLRLQMPDESGRRRVRLGLLVLVLIALGLSVYLFRGLPPIGASVNSILDPAGQADAAEQIRSGRKALTKSRYIDGGGLPGAGIARVLVVHCWQLACVGVVVYWSWVRTRRSAIWAACVSVLGLLMLASLGSRLPVLATVVMLFVALALRFRIGVSRGIGVAVLIFAFGLLVAPLSKGASGGDTFGDRVETLTTRVFEGNGRNNVSIVRLVDSGALQSMPGAVFVERSKEMVPGIGAEIPFALRLTWMTYDKGARTTSFSTPSQFGLIYADWKAVGVLPGYLICGMLIGAVWRFLLARANPAKLLLLGPVGWSLAYLSITGVHGLVVSILVFGVLYRMVVGPGALAKLQGSPAPADGDAYPATAARALRRQRP